MLKLHKVVCKTWLGHYDDDGNLVNEEVSQLEHSIYTPQQFVEFWAAVQAEVEQRNMMAAAEPAAISPAVAADTPAAERR